MQPIPFTKTPISTPRMRASALALVVALAACTQPAPPTPQAVRPTPPQDAPASLRAIRAAGDALDSAVQVQPLRDRAIDGYLESARAAEKTGDYARAAASANEALKLAPDAPDILQYLAEMDIARSEWLSAEKLAIRSFTLGPKVGSLCARNWQTVVEARTAIADAATATQAKQRLKECRVPPRLRM